MSIATLNKVKKELRMRILTSKNWMESCNKQAAEEAASILDWQDQIEDIDTAILILKKHIPVKGKK